MLELEHLSDDPRVMALDALSTPVWLVPADELRIIWANKSAVGFWRAGSLRDLVEDKVYQPSRTTLSRFEHTQDKLKQGQRTSEFWTLYPQGQPVSCKVTTSPFKLSDGTQVALVEAAPVDHNNFDQDMLRGVEALRYTNSLISIYSELGYLIMHNPAARDVFGDQKRLEQRFVDPKHALKMMGALQQDGEYSAEVEAQTKQGPQVHLLEVRFARDPVTGQRIILANAQDVDDRPTSGRLHQSYLQHIHQWLSKPLIEGDPQARRAAYLFEGLAMAYHHGAEQEEMALDVWLEEVIARCEAEREVFTQSITLRVTGEADWLVDANKPALTLALLQLLARVQRDVERPILIELEEFDEMYRVHVIDKGEGVPEAWKSMLTQQDILTVLQERDTSEQTQMLLHALTASLLIRYQHGWLEFITSSSHGTDFFFDLPRAI